MRRNQGDRQARLALAHSLRLLDRLPEAVQILAEGLETTPEDPQLDLALAQSLRALPAEDCGADLLPILEAAFAAPWINRQHLARPTALALKAKFELPEASVLAAACFKPAALEDSVLEALSHDLLLHKLLRYCVNVDPALELALTLLRRQLLSQACAGLALEETENALAISLAWQSFHNDYVFWVSPEEKTALIEQAEDLPPEVLALYEPPRRASRRLTDLTAQILAEEKSEADLASFGSLNDETSRQVRRQYEEHPYPRWLDLDWSPQQPYAVALSQSVPNLDPLQPRQEPWRVLVAGCGTGHRPVALALAHPDLEILATDISRRSLAYGQLMAERLGAQTVTFLQADILDLPDLEQSFDVIECSGVLHHMADPLAGWRALTACLAPQGLMKVALYSQLARSDVVAARDRIAALGLKPEPDDMRAFRKAILAGEESADFWRLTGSKDFHSLGGCRDLLFHGMEHRFTLDQLAAALATLGLDFLGFEFDDPALPQAYRRRFAKDPAMTDLGNWAAFEADHPASFQRMYRFWCRKP